MDEWKSKQDKYLLEGTFPVGRVPFLEIFGPCNGSVLLTEINEKAMDSPVQNKTAHNEQADLDLHSASI